MFGTAIECDFCHKIRVGNSIPEGWYEVERKYSGYKNALRHYCCRLCMIEGTKSLEVDDK
jgi:hypothetical protein